MRIFRKLFVKVLFVPSFLLVGGARAGAADAPEPEPALVYAKLPVKEVTIFKDGHAFVTQEADAPVQNGTVILDELPVPVLGTFWPYSVGGGPKLISVTASRRTVSSERGAQNLRELLEANIGAKILVRENRNDNPYPATLTGINGEIALLRTEKGLKALPLAMIADVTFPADAVTQRPQETERPELTLRFDWGRARPTTRLPVGLMYLQKGLRWIPSYKVTLDGKGTARIALQATLINELTDLNDVTANLVIGVPSWAFENMPDPMALQDTLAQLSPYFWSDSRTRLGLSNALASQVGGYGDGGLRDGSEAAAPPAGPEVTGAERREDLFTFTVRHVTLKKGQRMVLPITEFTVPYRDVYRLELPYLSPEQRQQYYYNNNRTPEIERLLQRPRFEHRIRLTNRSAYPLTTAPALLMTASGDVLSQALMTYTSRGGESDLTVTAAGDVAYKKEEKETGRTPSALNYNGRDYTRVDYAGTLEITNYAPTATEIEVVRYLLGTDPKADNGAVVEMFDPRSDDRPDWFQGGVYTGAADPLNGFIRLTWKANVPPSAASAAGSAASAVCLTLRYTWSQFR